MPMNRAIGVFLLLAWASAEAQFPPDTQYSSIPVPPLARPAYRVPVNDPVFGTRITRITDVVAFGAADVRHGYSRRQPWNFDQTRVMLDGVSNPSLWILDASTYAILGTVPKLPEVRWSNTDPNLLYGVSGNRLVSINASTGAQTTLQTFSGFTNILIGPYKGNLSNDDRYVALVADERTVIVYDVSADTVISTASLTSLGYPGSVSGVSISQSGNFIIIDGETAGSSHDRNLTKVADLGRLRHGDPGYDSNGNEVFVQMCPTEMVRLSNGQKTTLLNSGECGHVSARNYKRPGWAYVNFSAGRPQDVMAVKLDGSKTVERYTHHRSTQATYTAQSHVAASPDGTKVMYASNWNGTSEINSFVVDLPPTPPPVSPPTVSLTAPANGATVTGIVTVAANAADPGGGVLGVQFKVDGANLGAEDVTAPYSFSWNTATVGDGSHTLTAVARDAGNLTTSTPVGVTVLNAPPTNVNAKYSVQLRTSQVAAIESTVGPSPVLRLCGGPPPATASEPDGGTELAKMQLPPDWATTAVAGAFSKLGTWQGTAKFPGPPTHFRIYAADGVTPHIQGSVTGSLGNGVLTLGSMNLVPGQMTRINTFRITAGNIGLATPSDPNRLQFSTSVQNASLDRIQTLIGPSPILRFISGTVPASIDVLSSGSTIATMTLPPVWLAPASLGLAQMAGVWQDPSADATGLMTHAKFFDSTGTIPHILVDVTVGGAGILQVPTANVTAGDNVTVADFAVRAANQ